MNSMLQSKGVAAYLTSAVLASGLLLASGGATADPADDLIAKLRSNPSLQNTSFSVVFAVVANPGSERIVRQTMEAILPKTRAEPGNIAFELHADADNPRRFFLFERWKSVDALATHLKMPYIQTAFEVYGKHTFGDGLVMFGTLIGQ